MLYLHTSIIVQGSTVHSNNNPGVSNRTLHCGATANIACDTECFFFFFFFFFLSIILHVL